MDIAEDRRRAWLTAEELLNQRWSVNVKDTRFGATGNGTDDDYAAIQEAIDYVSDLGGGAAFIPRGNYILSSPIVIDTSKVVLYGDGVNSMLIRSSDGDIIRIDTSAAAVQYVQLRNFSIKVADSVSPASAVGIHILVNAVTPTGLQRSIISDIDIFNVQKGIAFDKGALDTHAAVAQLDPNNFNTITGVRIHADADIDYGVYWEGGSSGHNRILNCHLRGQVAAIKAGDGLGDTSVGDFLIESNTLISNTGRGIDIAGPATAGRYNQKLGIIGNDFDGTGMVEAFRVTDMSNGVIRGNTGMDKGFTLDPWNQFIFENNGVSFLEMHTVDTVVTVNNTATLADITDLAFEIQELEEVHFSLSLRTESGTTPDFKLGFSVPAGCAMRWSPVSGGRFNASGTFASPGDLNATQTCDFQGTAAAAWVHVEGYIINSTTAGTITPQFAQQTADASDTKVHTFSTIRIWRERNNY